MRQRNADAQTIGESRDGLDSLSIRDARIDRNDGKKETMNFDDTPQEAAFRAEAKAWIAANAPKQYEEELRKSSLGRRN